MNINMLTCVVHLVTSVAMIARSYSTCDQHTMRLVELNSLFLVVRNPLYRICPTDSLHKDHLFPQLVEYKENTTSFTLASSWNPIFAVGYAEWISFSYALLYARPLTKKPWHGLQLSPSLATLWNICMLFITWEAVLPINNKFIYTIATVVTILVQNRFTIKIDAPKKNDEIDVDIYGRKNVEIHNPNFELDRTARYCEYTVTSTFLFLALFAVAHELAWKYQVVGVALIASSCIHVTIHKTTAMLNDNMTQLAKSSGYLTIASCLCCITALYILLIGLDVPEWTRNTVYFAVILHSFRFLLISWDYVPTILWASDKDLTRNKYLDLISLVLSSATSWEVWTQSQLCLNH